MSKNECLNVLLGFVLGVAFTALIVLCAPPAIIIQEELQLECDLKDREVIHLKEAVVRLREMNARPRSQAITVTELKEGQYLLETTWDSYQITVERCEK